MVKLNWDEGGDFQTGISRPGLYRVEVKECTQKTSKGGDAMFELRLVANDYENRHLAFDTIMLGGKGWGIGKQKLKAFIEEGLEDIEAHDLVGKRVYAAVAVSPYVKEDGTTVSPLKVNIRAEGSHCGYYRPDEQGLEFNHPERDAQEDTPF